MKPSHTYLSRLILIFGAIIPLILAISLLYTTGLPDRADYSGKFIEGVGRVAPEINAIAPPFTQPTLSDDTLSLLDLRGESVVINFWATWCTPCLVEMPALQDLHDETNVRILGINMGEQRSIVEEWITANAITFDILLDPQGQVSFDYRLRGQPSTYVVAPDGIISHIFYGPVPMGCVTKCPRHP